MPTEDRYSSWSTRGKIVEFDDVHRLGRYASHHSADGHFYEYDLGVFWRTDLSAELPARQAIDDLALVPPGPWHHLPGCDCEVCDDAERRASPQAALPPGSSQLPLRKGSHSSAGSGRE